MEKNDRSRTALPDGATVYNRRSLRYYDFVVHFLSNRLAWRCPAKSLIEHSRKYLSDQHLEIGIGSGRIFKKAAAGQTFQRLLIADVNQDCLDEAAVTLSEFKPETAMLDLLKDTDPIAGLSGFDSIGLNYVLHCLPLTMAKKTELCCRLADECLNPGGVLFGSTLLPDLKPNWISKRLMRFYNRKKIFSNSEDTLASLEKYLREKNRDFELQTIGCVCLFVIRR